MEKFDCDTLSDTECSVCWLNLMTGIFMWIANQDQVRDNNGWSGLRREETVETVETVVINVMPLTQLGWAGGHKTRQGTAD